MYVTCFRILLDCRKKHQKVKNIMRYSAMHWLLVLIRRTKEMHPYISYNSQKKYKFVVSSRGKHTIQYLAIFGQSRFSKGKVFQAISN